MEFKVLTSAEKETMRGELIAMLKAGDKDFVPPISARFSASQSDFSSPVCREEGFAAYYADMAAGDILAAFEDGALLGFVSYKKDYTAAPIDEGTFPNLYICTLRVKKEARGKQLTARMYTHLFDGLYPTRSLYTRTWSTNTAHIAILARFGFAELHRIKNHRGEGIDTVYFYKKRP